MLRGSESGLRALGEGFALVLGACGSDMDRQPIRLGMPFVMQLIEFFLVPIVPARNHMQTGLYMTDELARCGSDGVVEDKMQTAANTLHASLLKTIAAFSRLLASCLLLGLTLAAPAQQYIFRNFQQAQGLNNLTITALATDNQGFLWVGTQNGLYRYLGSNFQRFGQEQGITEKSITGILTAPDGSIWAGTSKNLYHWNGMRFQPASPQPIPIAGSQAFAAEAPGRLLVLVGNQLQRLNYLPDGSFSSLAPLFYNRFAAGDPRLEESKLVAVAPDQTVWMGCGRQLCHWQKDVLQLWGNQQGLFEEVHQAITFDGKGSVWVVGERHILELPAGSAAFLDRTPPAFDLGHNFFEVSIAVDRSGRVVISSTAGLGRWNGTHWQKLGVANGIEPGIINSLLFDTAGDLWMGIFGGGVRQWVGYENWEGWTDRQGLPSPGIWSIQAHDSEHIIIGTDSGPATIDLGTGLVNPKLLTGRWHYGPVSSIDTAPNGDTLFATVDGDLLRKQAGSSQLTPLASLKTYIFKIFRDSSGRSFLLNYRNGILDLKDTPTGPHPVEIPEVKSLLGKVMPVYKACSTADGIDWFSNRTGILQFDHDRWRRAPIDGLPQPTPQLRGVACAGDNSLWINGNEYGIWHLVPKNGRLAATELILPQTVRSLSVLDIFSDSRGWLWLGTDDGLLVWNGSTWRHLTQEVGLIWNDLNQFNLAEGTDGSLWIGTSGGVAHLAHPEQVFAPTLPRIAMVEIRRGGESFPLSGNLQLPWSRSDLSLQFAAASTPNRDDLVFRYRIAGLQPHWTETIDTTAHFQALPPGRYAFEVNAQDKTSGAQSPILIIQIQVLPPWWRTLFAYFFYTLIALFAIALLFRLRMRRLLAHKRQLESLVAQRTKQLEASRRELQIQATHDGLTGLLNRAAVLSAFDEEIQRAQREHATLTLVLADIDHFKKVNDTYGHLAGDEALRRFSSAITQCIRNYDHAGRYGGEEFIIVLTGVDCASAQARIAALHACVTNLEVVEGDSRFLINCSLGAVCFDFNQQRIERKTILAAADDALYEAKRTGRNRFVLRDLVPAQAVSTCAEV